jgi:hypothetical protein
MKALRCVYETEEKKTLDIYYLAGRAVSRFTAVFQKLHNGILPTYLVWCLLGMIAMFILLFVR